jgi:HK97 family phage portal protein
MTVLVSNATLVNMPAGWWPTSTGGSLSLYNGFSQDYATLYKEQPNVRTCVDFLARNIAQLGLHLYRNDAEKGRIRLRDHPLAVLIGRPMPNSMKWTRYRMIESVMSDLGIYGNAFLKKEIDPDGTLVGLLRLPPTMMTVQGALWPTGYEVNLGTGNPKEYDPSEVVHFRGYSSESNVKGLSPLETLRRILAEEHAAGLYREKFWQNSARMNGVISRPKDAGTWSEQARQRFKKEWQSLYSGSDNSGKTAILEEGMEFKPVSLFQFLIGRLITSRCCIVSCISL